MAIVKDWKTRERVAAGSITNSSWIQQQGTLGRQLDCQSCILRSPEKGRGAPLSDTLPGLVGGSCSGG